ncbi:MAG: PIN domain-containing protein [Acidobacteria bacterium]|nr:PIN domain-containing protein [Acidobacteriota bacterium]
MHQRPIRTFLDAGVLITAYSGRAGVEAKAAAILEGKNRVFLASPFVRHELCPKAQFNKRQLEYRFYTEYFRRAQIFDDVRLILERAGREASRTGIGAMDSLHIAAAHLLSADEFITTEKPGKSIYRTKLVKVLYLFG